MAFRRLLGIGPVVLCSTDLAGRHAVPRNSLFLVHLTIAAPTPFGKEYHFASEPNAPLHSVHSWASLNSGEIKEEA
jgi:hypothetical protein